MEKNKLKMHPSTIFYSIRSYWLVFVAPLIRIVIQFITNGNTKVVLFSEVLAVSMVFFIAISNWFFTEIVVTDGKFIIKKNFLIKRRIVITLSRTSGIYVKRNLLDIILMSASVYFKTETDFSEEKIFKIRVKSRDLIKIFGKSREKPIRPVQNAHNFIRFFVVPMWVAIIIFLGSTIAPQIYWIVQVGALIALDVYYAVICLYNYKKGQINIGDNIFVIGSKGFTTCEFYCKKSDIGIISISQTPADRRLKTCKIRMIEYAESFLGIKIRNVDMEEMIVAINENFNLNINV